MSGVTILLRLPGTRKQSAPSYLPWIRPLERSYLPASYPVVCQDLSLQCSFESRFPAVHSHADRDPPVCDFFLLEQLKRRTRINQLQSTGGQKDSLPVVRNQILHKTLLGNLCWEKCLHSLAVAMEWDILHRPCNKRWNSTRQLRLQISRILVWRRHCISIYVLSSPTHLRDEPVAVGAICCLERSARLKYLHLQACNSCFLDHHHALCSIGHLFVSLGPFWGLLLSQGAKFWNLTK